MLDAYDIYRRTLLNTDGSDSIWWYLGTTTVQPEGHPEMIVNHVETVMIYRSWQESVDVTRARWWEIGAFRDAITGGPPTCWTNPLTGAVSAAPTLFEEGPAGFGLRPSAGGGVELFDHVQAHSVPGTVVIDARQIGDRICVTQTERKVRSFPDKDGLPSMQDGKAAEAVTVLQWFTGCSDLETGGASIPASGYYSLDIACPAWLGFGEIPTRFMVKGIMHKTPLDPPLNPGGWARLQALFPQHFKDGRIVPHFPEA